MSLDLIEPVRPEVDRWVLELLEGHTFTRDDFVETHEGQVRRLSVLERGGVVI